MEGLMIVTTTPNIEGKPIREYKGIVTGEAIMGANIFRDFFASITDIVGGRSAAYEKELGKARDVAQGEMIAKAREFGADAIVGVDLDYEVIRDGMLMVSVSGTAVKLG
jgi:uncharacterized protein YbjQ (UPF0145 family)